jgi:sulfoxide reductase heme-binding subunit YedZ
LIPLALTSNKLSVRRLGARWNRLHRLVYLIAILAVLHFIWLVKADYLEAGIYALIAAALLLLRLPIFRRYLSTGGKLRSANG